MDISIDSSVDNIRNSYKNRTVSDAAEKRNLSGCSRERQFDKVIITSSSRQVEEKKIAEELTRQILSEVNTPTPEAKIEELKQRVTQGTYLVDADRLADKILLQRGEQTDE
ncbi:flagellar biosynthesis anti-sigma factor FlgM [Clostridium sp. C105KSO13]|uniref:flagellar biosynthesis anti-sigma factor FlgM n=1 Tax=Clostridium sp. C105KSO13 TaxID=1776045 RepID=UPI0007407386|nr:flagellar biosynthesis anti-sigma factor FlgM [Clostridium sp. C105KSO13]CUX49601.1 Anti-sigma-28 factor, FlgM [Clostridium sp. C105KSO13]